MCYPGEAATHCSAPTAPTAPPLEHARASGGAVGAARWSAGLCTLSRLLSLAYHGGYFYLSSPITGVGAQGASETKTDRSGYNKNTTTAR